LMADRVESGGPAAFPAPPTTLLAGPVLKCSSRAGYRDERSKWPLIRERCSPFLQKPHTGAALPGILMKILS